MPRLCYFCGRDLDTIEEWEGKLHLTPNHTDQCFESLSKEEQEELLRTMMKNIRNHWREEDNIIGQLLGEMYPAQKEAA